MFFHSQNAFFLLAALSIPLLATAQQAADGVIVPFSSVLPACASLCGKLFDVQGACSPPAITSVSSTCFCDDARLQPFLQSGTAGVSSVCGPASCTATADLQKIQTWYESYCHASSSSPTATSSKSATTSTALPTSTANPVSSSPGSTNQGWFATHRRWVIMIIVIVVGLAILWIVAALLRRRYIRKRDMGMAMRPPVAWGPHQMQGATGGYGAGGPDARGAATKEARSQALAVPANASGKENKRWWKKDRQ